jgi:hypothetical protein
VGGKWSTVIKNVYISIRKFTYYVPFMKEDSGEAASENH